MLKRAWLWARSVMMRRRLEREMQEEMAEHLERSVARLTARGLTEREARHEALREFGNVALLQEEGRLARGTGWLDALLEDARFALRQFRRRWGTMLTMLAVLTGGLVVSTLLFTYLHAYAAAPPVGVPAADDLVRIRGSQAAGESQRGLRPFGWAEAEEYRRLSGHFRASAAWAEATVLVDAGGEKPAHGTLGEATFVEGDYFGVLGVRPMLGPGLPKEPGAEAGGALVAVISHTAWEQLYGRSRSAVGSMVTVNGVAVTVVGVAPPRFLGVGGGPTVQLWLPHEARHAVLPRTSVETLGYHLAGRLREEVGIAEAGAAAGVVAARAAAGDPALAAHEPATEVVPLLGTSGDPMHERDVLLLTAILGVLGLLVLGVACTNVGALQTGLAMARRQEIAIRLSLGASRRRVIRQLLTESALLALLAGVTALTLVQLLFDAADAMFPLMPIPFELPWPVALTTFGIALGAGVLFGLSPALHATRVAIASALQDSAAALAATRLRLQRMLVVAQIALTQPLIVLLIAGLLMVVGKLQPGQGSVDADRLVALRLNPATTRPGQVQREETPAQREAALRALLARLESVPGVVAAVPDARTHGDLGAYAVHRADRVPGGTQAGLQFTAREAAPGYFAVAGIPLLRGRDFAPGDAAATDDAVEVPVVIGAEVARRLFAGADPIGRRLRPAADSAHQAPTLVVAGVVADPEAAGGAAPETHPVFLPLPASAPPRKLLVRTAGPAEALAPALRTAAMEALPHMVASANTVAALEREATRTFRQVTAALAGGGALMLLLSAIGLYAVVAFAVGQRTREIAVRAAVGAPPGRIATRFVADGLRLSLLGLALGLPVGLIGLRGYNALVGLDGDFVLVAIPPVAATATLAIALVTLAATFVPARRASRVSPMIALRRQ